MVNTVTAHWPAHWPAYWPAHWQPRNFVSGDRGPPACNPRPVGLHAGFKPAARPDNRLQAGARAIRSRLKMRNEIYE